jgi:hypothetical protein
VPQDIEWALDDAGTIWLTQARPITSLYPVPPSRDGALRAFVCASLAQGLTRPITPMGLAAFGVIGGSLARLFGLPGPHATDLVAPPPAFAAGRRPRVRRRHGRAAQPARAGRRDPRPRIMEARTGVVLRELFADPAFAPVPGARRRALRRIVPVLVPPPRAAGRRAGDRLPRPPPAAASPASAPAPPPFPASPPGATPAEPGGSRDRGARDGRGGVPPQCTGLRGRAS